MNKQKIKRIISIFKLILLLVAIVGIPVLIYEFVPDIYNEFNDVEKLEALLEEYRAESIFIYIGLQIVQVVISVIPGEVVQLAGGYIFGVLLGTLWSVIGILIGTTIAFYISRLLGKSALETLFSEETLDKYINKLNSKKARIIIFILYLIPGMPKDMIVYAAGVSNINIKDFCTLSIIARLPALIVSMYMGKFMYTQNFTSLFILIGITVVIFIICVIFRKRMLEFVDKIFKVRENKDKEI